jgi:gluconate 2-dehydrogenase subunit 3-like protein
VFEGGNYNPNCPPMKRRAVLRSLLAVPAAAALPTDAPAQEVKASPPELPKTLTTEADSAAMPIIKTFDSAQLSALRKLGEILMPAARDTPGAVEAGAAEFLDFLIGVSPPARLTLYRSGLDQLNAEAHQRYKRSFGEITAAEAEPILAPLGAPWSYRGPADPFAKFLLAAKSDLLTATANSREYVSVVSQRRRGAGGVGQYWYSTE